MTRIPINEIFGPTIQGEGPNVGARCIFVRVQGCSYRCEWCDTKQTWDMNGEYVKYDQNNLIEYLLLRCKSTSCYHVVLTGGNPCLYDFTHVVSKLQANSIVVDVETQGDLYPDWLTDVDTLVFSPKAPSSKMLDTYTKITYYIEKNQYRSTQTIAVKIPVFSDIDIDFARRYASWIESYNRINDNTVNLYLSVGNTDVNIRESIRDRVLADYESLLNKINENPEHFEHVFILPQLHTLVWGNKSGV